MMHRHSLLLTALLLWLSLSRAHAQATPTILWPGEIVVTG